MTAIEFGFGSEPLMKEVPPGTEAVFRFNGKQEQVETDFGKKYSFPITLLSHPSYPLLEDGPMNMVWQSKSACAKQLYTDLQPEQLKESGKYGIALKDAYNNAEWQLTRFDTGTYFLTKK
tara:strand:- start:1224 stop:1583 length:360 start_codon:yes stop_codon:yes gene_type:complete